MILVIFEEEYTGMLKIHKNYSLRNNTTFAVDIASSYFAEPANMEEIQFAFHHAKEHEWSCFLIGEGSNLLFTTDYDGLIIHPKIMGVETVDESDSEVLLRVGSGENWDDLVSFCVRNAWFGAENLSLIPGSVGAAPIQNIGAYGVEAKDIIDYVEVYDVEERKVEILSNNECEFGYRDSVFKHRRKNRYVVTHVVFRLKKNGELKLNYGNVEEEFLKCERQDLQNLRNSIIKIRESKLPDPANYGSAGSYFKNPIISSERFEQLQKIFDKIPHYPVNEKKVKVPAAWLIEQAGWKGIRKNNVGTWPIQPLVIVNYGNSSGKEIFDFSEKIRLSIQEKFDINLEREVTVI